MKNHKMGYRVDPPTVDMEDYIWSIDGKYKIYDTETGEWKELSQEDPAKKAIYTFIIYLSVTKGLIPESPEFSKHCKVVVVNGEAKLLDQYYFNSKEWYSISSGLSDGTTAYGTVDNRLHTEDNNEDVYYSIIMIDGFGNILNASTPENLKGTKGEQGKPGIDGSVIEYLYKRFKTLDEAELAIPPVSKDDDGWTEEPKGVNATFRVEVVSDRKRDIESGEWSDWSDPVVGATYSDDGLDGTTYKEFKVYTLVPDYLNAPKTPTGGTGSPGNERLLHLPVDPDGIYEGTDIAPQVNEKYAWYSTAVFRNSDGAKDSNGTPPVRYGSIPVEVDKYYRYYQAFNKETLDPEDIPSLNEDPIEKGWSLENNTHLSEDLKYVWSFERITYSTEQSFQTEPVIIRQYIAEVEADYSRVKEVAEGAITEQLDNTTSRLGQIEQAAALINKDEGKGLIELITSYKDENQTSFADIIANAADATIKQSVGSAIGHDITGVDATLDGINGLLQNQVTKLSGIDGTVAGALQQMRADSIIQSVSAGKYYWQRQIHDPASDIVDPTVEGYWVDDTEDREELPIDGQASTVEYKIENVTDEGIIDNTPDPISGTIGQDDMPYQGIKATTINKMSAINQTSDKIELLLGDGEGSIASIVMDDLKGGRIKIDASTIELNGQVIARAINADSITIGKKDQETGQWLGGYAILGPEGLMASGAKIIGNLYSSEGFFGYYEEDENTHQITTRTGVHIGIMGSDNDTEGTGGLGSSNYHINQSGFLLGGEHFEFYGQNGSYIKDTDLKLAQGTIGGITITSTELIGKNTVEYLIISYNGKDYAVIKDGVRQMTATCDLINAVLNRDGDPNSTGLRNGIKANITHSNNTDITKEQGINWSNNSSYSTTYSERTENKVDFGFSTDHTSGNSICAGFGGIKEDRASSSDNRVDAAKILFRYDGSGYLASNKLKGDTNGNVNILSGATIGPFKLDDDGFNYVTEYFKDRSPDTDELVHTEISLNTDKLRVYKGRAPQQTYDPDATKSIGEEVVISSNKIKGQGGYNYTNFDGVSVIENHNFTIENNGNIYGAQFTLSEYNTLTPIRSNVITVGDPELRYGGLTFEESDVEIYINPTIYTPGKIFGILPTATVSKFRLKCAYPVYSGYGGRGHALPANESDPGNIPAPIMVIFGSERLIYTIKMGGTS